MVGVSNEDGSQTFLLQYVKCPVLLREHQFSGQQPNIFMPTVVIYQLIQLPCEICCSLQHYIL